MIWFCYFCKKKKNSFLDVAHDDPFSAQIGSKKPFLIGFTNFFRTSGLQHKLLILIVSTNIFH